MASPAYERRNARARAAGYRSYYDYRIHDHGRIPAGRPAPPAGSEERSRLRGHRGAADLQKLNLDGAIVAVIDYDRNRRTGRYSRVTLAVVDPNTGRERYFTLRGQALSADRLPGTVAGIVEAGGIISPNQSLDLRRYANESVEPDEADDEAARGELDEAA